MKYQKKLVTLQRRFLEFLLKGSSVKFQKMAKK